MDDSKRTHYVSVVMNDDELKAVDDWGWAQRIRSRAECIRQLIARGLAVADGVADRDAIPEPAKKPRKKA